MFHALILGLILFGPEWTFLRPDPAELEATAAGTPASAARAGARGAPFRLRPAADRPRGQSSRLPALSCPISTVRRAPASARRSRRIRFRSRAAIPSNERSRRPEERARGAGDRGPSEHRTAEAAAAGADRQALPPADTGIRRDPETSRPAPGRLGDALRNLERYVQNQTFNNPQGGANDPGSTIQFDTKAVEFGPWIRRFVAQVRRNWLIPHAAMSFRGHVVIQFTIHRNGRITDVRIVSAFVISTPLTGPAYNAIVSSSPTEPLPPEYPDPMAFLYRHVLLQRAASGLTVVIEPGQRPLHYLRSDLNPARISSDRNFGCSQAAKCPPLGSLL